MAGGCVHGGGDAALRHRLHRGVGRVRLVRRPGTRLRRKGRRRGK